MNSIRILLASVTLAGTSSAAAAQAVTVYDPGASARANVKVSYGGHGPDLDASVESPLLMTFVRVRGAIGRGNWVGVAETHPPSGSDPSVTRLAGAVMITGHFAARGRPPEDYVRWYVGAGITALVPRGVGMDRQRGTRVILGVDFSGERWTVAPELEFDIPRHSDVSRPFRGDDLVPTARIGLALRRHF